MATYLTPDELRLAASPAGQSANTAASLSDDELAAAIAEAQGTIDGYIGARYVVPLATPVAAIVKSLVTSIALYLATLTYRRSLDLTSDDPVVRRYNHAMAFLQAVAAGKAVIPGTDDGSGGSNSGDAYVQNPYSGDLFGLGQPVPVLEQSLRSPRWWWYRD